MPAPPSRPRWRAPYTIATDRLRIRALGPEHFDQLNEVIPENKAHLSATMAWVIPEPLAAEARTELLLGFRGRYDLGRDFTMGIFDAATDRYIGGTGLHTRRGPEVLEIGYWIAHDQEGRGLIKETVTALTAVAIEHMRATRVEIYADVDNARSRGVAERLGFHLDGIRRAFGHKPDGQPTDQAVYTLLASEFPTHPLAAAPRPALFDVHGHELPMRIPGADRDTKGDE